MKNIKNGFIELVLPFIIAWFLMTILVDIITIPTVFRHSSNILDAGKIGMIVFGRFNFFEIFFSSSIFIGSVLYWKKQKRKKWLYFSLPLLILSLVYKLVMTPMISQTTLEIQKTSPENPVYIELQKQHAAYHNMYRTMDTAKLFSLLIFSGIVLFDRIKSNKEKA